MCFTTIDSKCKNDIILPCFIASGYSRSRETSRDYVRSVVRIQFECFIKLIKHLVRRDGRSTMSEYFKSNVLATEGNSLL